MLYDRVRGEFLGTQLHTIDLCSFENYVSSWLQLDYINLSQTLTGFYGRVSQSPYSRCNGGMVGGTNKTANGICEGKPGEVAILLLLFARDVFCCCLLLMFAATICLFF